MRQECPQQKFGKEKCVPKPAGYTLDWTGYDIDGNDEYDWYDGIGDDYEYLASVSLKITEGIVPAIEDLERYS